MNNRYWFTAMMAFLMISAGSIGCGGSPDGSDNAGDNGNVAQTSQALSSGQNFGDCTKIRSNPCVTYNACGLNWCSDQVIWCPPCR